MKLDLRVNVAQTGMEDQLKLAQQTASIITASYDAHHKVVILREAIAADEKKLQMQAPDAVKALQKFDAMVVNFRVLRLDVAAAAHTRSPGSDLRGHQSAVGRAGNDYRKRRRCARARDGSRLRGRLPRSGERQQPVEHAASDRASRNQRTTGDTAPFRTPARLCSRRTAPHTSRFAQSRLACELSFSQVRDI